MNGQKPRLEDTTNLKTHIEEVQRSGRVSYFIAYIWARDPYNQFKTVLHNSYGTDGIGGTSQNYYLGPTTKTLLDNKVKNDKYVIAMNGGAWAWSDENYKNTTSFLTINNGNVKRDLTSGLVLAPNKKQSISKIGVSSGASVSAFIDKNGILNYYRFNLPS